MRVVRKDRKSPGVCHTWSAEASQLAAIRLEVRRWLTARGLSDAVQRDVVLAVDEAASNAVEHAYPAPRGGDTIEVTLWTDGPAICIEIVDHGRWRPPLSPELTSRGRGIPMMRQLVDSVLISYDKRGTRVFLRHAVPRGPPTDDRHSPVAPT